MFYRKCVSIYIVGIFSLLFLGYLRKYCRIGNDWVVIESKGSTFTNTQTYINTSTNTSIEFNPNTMYYLKVVRLNKNIYVYYDNCLALTTEFSDENPSGKVGFDVYESIGYFRNFFLRPILSCSLAP